MNDYVQTIPGSLFAAMVTPYDDRGSLALSKVERLVDHLLSQNIDGLYVGGSTGECALQSTEERMQYLDAVASHAVDRCTLIAHVGAFATRDAVALAKTAQDTGYRALAALPPYNYKYNSSDIAEYYRTIADATELPLIIYHMPQLTSVQMSLQDFCTLLDDERFAGVKYTDTDLFQLALLRERFPAKRFYFGYDEMFLAAVAIGVNGGIGSTYNLIGGVYAGIIEAVHNGDMKHARELQSKVNKLVEILYQLRVLPGIKYALNKIGIPVGSCRLPLSGTLKPEVIRKLDEWLANNIAVNAEVGSVGSS